MVKAMDSPSFDERSLSTLTDKIELRLREVTDRAATSPQKLSSRKAKPQKSSSTNHVEIKVPGSQSGVGKKRDSRGNFKDPANIGHTASKVSKDQHSKADKHNHKVLLTEILSLGGTEDDLDLVRGELSDEDDVLEESLPHIPDPKFTKELSKFVAELGINGSDTMDPDVADLQKGGEELERNVTLGNSAPAKEFKASRFEARLKVTGESAEKAKGINRLMFEPRSDWHAAPLPSLPEAADSGATLPRNAVSELKKQAYYLLEEDSKLYASKNLSSTSSHRFLSTIMSSGTLSDKVSALTLVVQESPVHTIKSFDGLLVLAKKRSRGQAVTALGAIKDLLGVGTVLPEERRLRFFENQPGLLGTLQEGQITNWKLGSALPGKISNMHMIYWAYEDWLKNSYFEVLKVLEGWCNDEVEFARGRAVNFVYELLRGKPEQESNLLRLLVNKLGDPDKKIASRTSYLILQLQTIHPLMKPIIIRAIESELLLRPGQGTHAKYYAVNTLNQTILSGREEDLARKLLSVYFDLFVNLLKKPEMPKPASGLTINRKGQIQGGGGEKGKKANEKAKKEELAKYSIGETTEKMISAVLTGVNRAFPFSRSDDLTLEKHMDVLFKITHSSNFNTSIQALMLIQQLAASKHIGEDRFYRTLYESLLDPRLIISSKHAMYLNLLFRSLKSDLDLKRIKAFAKRLLQIINLHQPPFICGVLYLLRELEVTFPGLKSLLQDPEEWEEVDEEVFYDMPEGPSVATSTATETQEAIHMHSDQDFSSMEKRYSYYDGRKRDPEHSRAEKSCLWELLPFLTHFHPSVSMFASRLLYGREMPAKPDLASHTLIHFLDRFVYKNAKAGSGGIRGSSIMQPLAGSETQAIFVSNRLLSHHSEPLNAESFWRKTADNVAVDEVFFHRYFNQISKGKQSTRRKATIDTATQDGNENIHGEEDEDEIWQALVESRPEVEGHSEDDNDLDMLDSNDSEDDSETENSVYPDIMDGDELSQGSEAESTYSSEDSNSPTNKKDTLSDMDELFSKELEIDIQLDNAAKDKQGSMKKKRKLKNLPIFASTEEYADMLAHDDDEDL